ncbi:MAG: hypothetical protein KAV82_05910 [Phycisphaerae bacterium]|nr:hypothetical protein [Phycisphaerae bacterium]
MIIARCRCGARYKVPAGAEGRKARCKKCGEIFQIPGAWGGAIPLAGEPKPDAVTEAQTAPAPAETASGSMFDQVGTSTAYDPDTTARSKLPRIRPRSGFWADVGWTLIFFSTPSNLVMFGIVWILYLVSLVAGFAPFIGWIASLFVTMFIISWYMSIITETASGEDDLPKFSGAGGYWDEIVVPAMQYAGSWVMLILPAIIYAVFSLGGVDSFIFSLEAVSNPYGFVVSGGSDPLLIVLVVAAIFLWPMALMCASMGGLTTLVRVDLIAVTIAKTLLPYLLISLLVAASVVLPGILTEIYAGAKTGAGTGMGSLAQSTIMILSIAFVLEAYFSIVMARLIGLYYRHFKRRFAWDWE